MSSNCFRWVSRFFSSLHGLGDWSKKKSLKVNSCSYITKMIWISAQIRRFRGRLVQSKIDASGWNFLPWLQDLLCS